MNAPSDGRKSLQETYGPNTTCFGCGPANAQGLRIRSFIDGEHIVADWQGQVFHEAFPGVLSGGIIGTLLDCHSNWTAAWYLMQRSGTGIIPCTVTAEFHVKLLRPTPQGPVHLDAKVVDAVGDRATVEATLEAGGKVTARCVGTFVAVKEGHPAYHRWG